MRRYFYFLILLFPCCQGNRNFSLEKKIINSLNCDTGICMVDLQEITPFKWDTLYIFNELDDSSYISKIISLPYSGAAVPDGKNRMIFVHKRAVAYEEDFGGVTYKTPHIYIFMPIDTTSYSIEQAAYTKTNYFISSKDAKFIVQKVKENKNSYSYYYLIPKLDEGRKLVAPG